MNTLKTIAIAAITLISAMLASCSQNEPEIRPNDGGNNNTTGNYIAVARLTVNDSIMPFVESVQVRYTLPGETEKIENLSFRPLETSDIEVKVLNANGISTEGCNVAAFEKTFKTTGEVKMQMIVNIDTTRTRYAEKYEAIVLPMMAAGLSGGTDKYAQLKFGSDVFHNAGIRADHLMEYLQRIADSLTEKTYTLH